MLTRLLLATTLVLGSACGQDPTPVQAKIAEIRYPPLARMARISGDVRVRIQDGTVKVISGHPLLIGSAMDNAPKLGAVVDVVYHFVIVESTRKVKRGNAFERGILRMFGGRTEKVIGDCDPRDPPPPELKQNGATAEIWIYARAACVQTEDAIVARR